MTERKFLKSWEKEISEFWFCPWLWLKPWNFPSFWPMDPHEGTWPSEPIPSDPTASVQTWNLAGKFYTLVYAPSWQIVFSMGLSTRDLGSESDAHQGSGFKDHFASTRPRSRSELRAVLRDSACNRVREFKSSSAMRVVCMPCGARAIPHWIRIRDPNPVNPVSVLVWRAPLSCWTGQDNHTR